MEILEAFDLTSSFRDAGSWRAARTTPWPPGWPSVTPGQLARRPARSQRRQRKIDPYLPKVEEWVERSRGKVRADVVFRRLCRLGFAGSERSVRRAVCEPRRSSARATTGSIGPGSPSRACGPSGTGAKGHGSEADGPTCSAPGWPGAATGWSSRPGTAPCRR